MSKVLSFLKNEIVLVISFFLAVLSMFFVTPDSSYIAYIDFRTLSLLLCLMAVVAGINGQGVFRLMAESLLKKVKSVSQLSLTLCLLCYFSSMLITNDVALITFVPFTIVALKMSGLEKKLIPIVTMETISANLGSMLTPVGNPQNLYLFSYYDMPILQFFRAVFPYALLSLVLIIICCLVISGRGEVETDSKKRQDSGKLHLIIIYTALFVLALLSVLRVIHYIIPLAVTLVSVLIFDRKTIKAIDYSLLFTFVFLFVFIGNLGRITVVSEFLHSIVNGNEVIVGIGASQLLSNVPSAILLSGFTRNAQALLVGVNLGGLGTLIASMASLISYKFVQKERVNTGKYILVFTILNILFLAAGLLLWLAIR